MNLITLNVWGGIVYEPLLKFIQDHAEETDIFCFQEVLFGTKPEFTPLHKARLNLLAEIETRLPGHKALTYPAPDVPAYFQSDLLPNTDRAGQAIFVRGSIEVTDQGGFRTYREGIPHNTLLGGRNTGSCQWMELKTDAGQITILNLHGLWQLDTNKVDTPERLIQSQIITDFLKTRSEKEILCGDFNLRPDTKSVSILETSMKNLIKEFDITSTRSELYPKAEKFADYILVSPEVTVEDFRVLPDVVSDHLPLRLTFA